MSSLIPVKSPKVFTGAEHIFLTKFKMVTKRYVEVVIPELLDTYFNVIPHFHMIFNAEFISEAISNFQDFAKNKIQDDRHLRFHWEQLSFVFEVHISF